MLVSHFVPRINYGGGTQSIISEAICLKKMGIKYRYQIISIEKNITIDLVRKAVLNGVRVYVGPNKEELQNILLKSDISVLHFWNCPAIFEFLKNITDTPLRLIVYSRVNGLTVPQKLPLWLMELARHVIFTNPRSSLLLRDRKNIDFSVIPAIIDPQKIPSEKNDFSKKRADRIKILYAGTVNFFKMHSEFVGIHKNLNIKQYGVNIYGTGGAEAQLKKEISQAKNSSRIKIRGIVQDMLPVYRTHHILSHPISEYSYASSDKVIQEAMWNGLPVVVFKNCPVSEFIEHEQTGFHANSIHEFRSYLEDLAKNQELRQRMENNSVVKAKEFFHPGKNTRILNQIYKNIMNNEKSSINFSLDHPSEYFFSVMRSAGLNNLETKDFLETEKLRPLVENEQTIEFFLSCEGGLFQFYNAYPDDQRLIHLMRTFHPDFS